MERDAEVGPESHLLPPALQALDAAVRGILTVLEIEQVLQLIVDRVRELVSAQYAALGIVAEQGIITRFITSGITIEQRRAIGDLPRGRGLLGLIIRENRSYRIPKISAHAESHGFPANHSVMVSGCVSCEVVVAAGPDQQQVLPNRRDDEALVQIFRLHAGIVIEKCVMARAGSAPRGRGRARSNQS